jgi:hypothetical protein
MARYFVKHRDKFTFILLRNKCFNIVPGPVPMAARSKVRTIFDRSKTGIVGSNPAQGMDVCLRFSVLCCPV